MKASRMLFDAEDYGNAAYHMQQAVEKGAKTILYHAGTTLEKINVDEIWGHRPFDFSAEIQVVFDKIESLSNKYNVSLEKTRFKQLQDQFISQLKGLTRELNGQVAKCALWKKSIAVPLDNAEQSFFRRYPLFESHYRLSMTSAGGVNGDPELIDDFFDVVNKDEELRLMKYYLGVAEMGRLLAAAWPHEDIGRYPTPIKVAGKEENSVDLYRQHKNELKELIDVAASSLKIQ